MQGHTEDLSEAALVQAQPVESLRCQVELIRPEDSQVDSHPKTW